MKHISIRLKYTAVFALVLIAALAGSITLNNLLLSRYYIRTKTETMVTACKNLEDFVKLLESEQNNDSESQLQISPMPGVTVTIPVTEEKNTGRLTEYLNKIQEQYFISTIIINDKGSVTAQGVDENWILHILNQKQMYYDSKGEKKDELLVRTDNYKIMKTYDSTTGTYYLEGWGTLTDNSRFLMRAPVAAVNESVSISNRFYIYVGILVLVLGTVLMYLVMGYITNPLVRLTHLSEKMSQLDFEAKYEGRSNDEIGELGRHMNDMSKTLEDTIAKLKKANLELKSDIDEKNKLEQMRNDFFGNVSHELKTPLALIQGYAEGLADGIADDPESTKYYCDVIIDEAGKMNRMIKNLLSLNQLEFGREQLSIERFDLTAVVKGVAEASRLLAKQKDGIIIFDERRPVYVWGDEYRMEEVVTNFVSNAINHLEGKKEIVITIDEKPGAVRVNVFNTGKQIPEEDIDRIWDKFYKVDKAHTRQYGGNGIGLSIVKAVMEAHGGCVGVENKERGVLFFAELPTDTAQSDLSN